MVQLSPTIDDSCQRVPISLEQPSCQSSVKEAFFWDARATGYLLQSPDAEQAQHPPVDPGEMGLPDTACIAFRLQSAAYKTLFEEVWVDSLDIRFPSGTEEICATPEGAAVFDGCPWQSEISNARFSRS